MRTAFRQLGMALLVIALNGGCRPGEASAAAQERPRTGTKDAAGNMKPVYSKLQYDITPLTRERVAELAAKLDPEVYRVTQKGSSRISGERCMDLEEEVLVITEPVGHPLHDLDLVVDALQQTGV